MLTGPISALNFQFFACRSFLQAHPLVMHDAHQPLPPCPPNLLFLDERHLELVMPFRPIIVCMLIFLSCGAAQILGALQLKCHSKLLSPSHAAFKLQWFHRVNARSFDSRLYQLNYFIMVKISCNTIKRVDVLRP